MMRILLALLVGLMAFPASAFDHGPWDQLLDRHVQWQRHGVASVVDYQGMERNRDTLTAYLQRLSQVDKKTFNGFTRNEKRAFFINAYNAFTVELILRQEQRPDSIRDIGSFFSGPWDQRFFSLLGKKRTLDELEHDMIRGNPALMDPRIHFAVNCASISCPPLRPEAYRGKQLDSQLDDNTRRFLRDRQRNRYQDSNNRLLLSKIFDWYQSDFSDAAGSLSAFLLPYSDELALPQAARQALENARLSLRFLPYDWSLNATEGQ